MLKFSFSTIFGVYFKSMAKNIKKEKLIALVETISRPGTAAVVELIRNSNFASKFGGASHHRYRGGLVDHSLEVYEYMKEKANGLDIPEESLIVCSIFHDLGKLRGHYNHQFESVAILEECGFQLNEEEKLAITTHHEMDGAFRTGSLQSLLKKSDVKSTGADARKNGSNLSLKEIALMIYGEMS